MKDKKAFVDMLLNFRKKAQFTMNYDGAEDVLYINFSGKPKEADDATQIGDYIIRCRNNEVIGITILNAREHSRMELIDAPEMLKESKPVFA